MLEILTQSSKQAFIITSLVMMMMLLVEYINVQTKALLTASLNEKPIGQIIIGAFFGITPGCLGAYTMVSLYIHRAIGLAALVTTMIATSGDEAFIMFSMIPKAAIKLHIIIFIISILSGIAVYYAFKNKNYFTKRNEPLPYHNKIKEQCVCFKKEMIIPQLKNMSFTRFLLLFIGFTFLILLLSSSIGPQEWNWKKWIFFSGIIFSLFIFFTTPDHFIEEHIWNHIFKKHLFKIFIWTFGTLLILHSLEKYIDIHNWVQQNVWIILIIAILIGIIPESGPHLVFVTLFAQGSIPFAILLANSIVQDGHGMLPLLAESRTDFLKVKGINIIVGLITGITGLLLK